MENWPKLTITAVNPLQNVQFHVVIGGISDADYYYHSHCFEIFVIIAKHNSYINYEIINAVLDEFMRGYRSALNNAMYALYFPSEYLYVGRNDIKISNVNTNNFIKSNEKYKFGIAVVSNEKSFNFTYHMNDKVYEG